MADLSETQWRKSSFCNTNSCVEVAVLDSHVAMRDAKQQTQSALFFTKAEWGAFLEGARNDEFDFGPGAFAPE